MAPRRPAAGPASAAETANAVLSSLQQQIATAGETGGSNAPQGVSAEVLTAKLGTLQASASTTAFEAQQAAADIFNDGDPATAEALEGLSPNQAVLMLQAARVWLTPISRVQIDIAIQQIVTGTEPAGSSTGTTTRAIAVAGQGLSGTAIRRSALAEQVATYPLEDPRPDRDQIIREIIFRLMQGDMISHRGQGTAWRLSPSSRRRRNLPTPASHPLSPKGMPSPSMARHATSTASGSFIDAAKSSWTANSQASP